MIEIKLYLPVLMYVDNNKILDGRLQAFKKYTEVLVVASKDV
jgi:hypothetical protein